jgi:hypothetical protein
VTLKNLIRAACLTAVLALFPWTQSPLAGADTPSKKASQPVTGCPLKAQGVTVKAEDVMVTPKQGYVHVLIDLFPYHDRLKSMDDKGWQALALSAARDCAALKHPGNKVKVDVVEFKERDTYGAPVWSSVKVLGKYSFAKQGTWRLSATDDAAPQATSAPAPAAAKKTHWVCPMHDGGESDHAGKCPKCGMDLVEEPL